MFHMFRKHGALVHLHDVAVAVDQEGCWKAEIAMTVEQLAIENVVDGGNVVGCAQNRKGKLPGEDANSAFGWIIHVHGD